MKAFYCLIIVLFLVSCGSSKPAIVSTTLNNWISSDQIDAPFFDVIAVSTNKQYGLSSKYPVKVGEKSASNQRRYLAALAGPNGETISFYRKGSCCPYKSDNGFLGEAFVDIYAVTHEGLEEPIDIYISFYDDDELLIPVGFTRRDF